MSSSSSTRRSPTSGSPSSGPATGAHSTRWTGSTRGSAAPRRTRPSSRRRGELDDPAHVALHAGAAELLGVTSSPSAAFTSGGPAVKIELVPRDHHHEVGHRRGQRAVAGRRTQHDRRRSGTRPERSASVVRSVGHRHVALEHLADPGAGALEEADERHALVAGEAGDPLALGHPGDADRTALHREVLGADAHRRARRSSPGRTRSRRRPPVPSGSATAGERARSRRTSRRRTAPRRANGRRRAPRHAGGATRSSPPIVTAKARSRSSRPRNGAHSPSAPAFASRRHRSRSRVEDQAHLAAAGDDGARASPTACPTRSSGRRRRRRTRSGRTPIPAPAGGERAW